MKLALVIRSDAEEALYYTIVMGWFDKTFHKWNGVLFVL
jgi:hypothetical protein